MAAPAQDLIEVWVDQVVQRLASVALEEVLADAPGTYRALGLGAIGSFLEARLHHLMHASHPLPLHALHAAGGLGRSRHLQRAIDKAVSRLARELLMSGHHDDGTPRWATD